MSASDPSGDACRVCGRSALAHPSGACRNCRRGKPSTWIAPKPRRSRTAKVLSDEERATSMSGGWRERNHSRWERRPPRAE